MTPATPIRNSSPGSSPSPANPARSSFASSEKILRTAAETLDFTRPIGLMLMGILGHLTDDEDAIAIVNRLVAALPPGSYLVIADGTDVVPEALRHAQDGYNDTGAIAYRMRDSAEVARFFEGVELLSPGVCACLRWRPETAPIDPPTEVQAACGVGYIH